MGSNNRFIFYNHTSASLEHLIDPDWLAIEGMTTRPSLCESIKLAVIQDYIWYSENQTELESWARHCLINFRRRGMILFFHSEDDRNLFAMRWG